MSTSSTASTPQTTTLSSKRGQQILALLCAVAFLDFVDASIVNVALPTIRDDIGFSIQSLQWVLSGYLLTYGGFMLLGGRAADLIGRRKILVAGTILFGLSSLIAGLASSEATLIAARAIQGVGAAMMLPAALSLLTTTFSDPADRYKAMGAWGAMAGLASGAGVFLGGLLSDELGWRWVFLVNVPVTVGVLFATFRLFEATPGRGTRDGFDFRGAVLATVGMLLLVFTIVEAPEQGWGATSTVAGLVGAAGLLTAFTLGELRHPNPLFPFSIFKVKGLAAADVTQMIAMAGFFSIFFFLTLYMQNVLGYSQIQAGAAYLPTTFTVAIFAGIGSKLLIKTGTRPLIVVGGLIAAGAVFYLARVPLDASYAVDLLPGLGVMGVGLGLLFVGTATAANAGVPPDKAGLAAALLNTSQQLGAALGIAVFSAIATSRTNDLISGGSSEPVALTAGFERALLFCAIFLVAAAVIALRAPNTHGETEDDEPEQDGPAAGLPDPLAEAEARAA